MDLGISGLASGFDWKSVVDQLDQVERAPEDQLRTQQSTLNQKRDAVQSLINEVQNLQTKAKALTDSSLFNKRTTSVSDTTVASASTTDDTPTGTYSFQFTQLASSSVQRGATDVAANLYTSDVTSSSGSGPLVTSAAFANPVTAGTFTVNGQQVTVTSSDSLQDVFAKIEAADPTITASYSATTDKITLSSTSGSVVLGSAADTSNFLQVARLSSGGASVSSAMEVGRLSMTSTLGSNPFKGTTLNNGGTGSFKVNGVEIAYSATDSISAVLKKISSSSAGVDASYDSLNDQIILTNRKQGSIGISLEDVGSGNFLAAAKLTTAAGGALEKGTDLKFKLNGGAEQTAFSGNSITELDHGVTGLQINAVNIPTTVGQTVTVTIGKDTATPKKAITDFFDEYNKVQSLIDTQTKSSTDSDGKVTAGILASDYDVYQLAQSIRGLVMNSITLDDGSVVRVDQIGYTSGGFDNQISLSDSTALDTALSSGTLASQILGTSGNAQGIAAQMQSYLDKLIGDDGTLVQHKNNYNKESTDIDSQIDDMEKNVQANHDRLTNEFLAMEQAQSQINQQMQYLTKSFG